MTRDRRQYRIIESIGKGSFGTVYRAQLLSAGDFAKDVAIKLMHPNLEAAEEAARRQRDEARMLGLVRHRAILQVDGLIRLNNTWAVVMEYIDGADLGALLKQGVVPVGVALEIVGELAGALDVAYRATTPEGKPLRIIHRDIKPSNVQISRVGEVKLLDFGIARADFDTRESRTENLTLGTFRYMSPERLDGIDGPEGDVYALGVMLVQMISKAKLGKTSSHPERHEALVEQAIAATRKVAGEEIAALVRRLLAYEPSHRPSAAELETLTWKMRKSIEGPRLSEWARVAVERAQVTRPQRREGDSLIGRTLSEQSEASMIGLSSGSLRPPPLRPSRRGLHLGLGLLVVGGGAVLLGSLGLAGLGLWWLGQEEVEEAPPLSTLGLDVGAPAPTPEPPPASESSPEPEQAEAVEEEAPQDPLAPSSQPEPKRSASVTPHRPARPMGTLRVEPDGASIRVVGPQGEVQAGALPAGTYQVFATFSGRPEMSVGEVNLVPDGEVRVVCNAAFFNCRVR